MVEGDSLPDTVQAGIDAFAGAVRQVFSEDLVSIVLYGSAADARLRATSDVNLILVLKRASPAALDAIGPAYRLARAAIRLSVMFILETEIAEAADAFAVKFLDVVARHKVIWGSDPFRHVEVDRAAAKRRLRQVLVNLILRLREQRALDGAFPEQLVLAAADSVGPLRASAAVLLSLETGETMHPRDALTAIAEAPGHAAALAAITRARETGAAPEIGAAGALDAALDLAQLLHRRAEGLDR